MKAGIKRLPPVLTGALVVMWLLLNQTLAPGHVLLGVAFAVALAWASTQLRPLRPRLARSGLALWLAAIVLVDIVRSNIAVARIMLGLVRDREVKSGFVRISLDLRDPHGLAVLAVIITSTPGTAWAGFVRRSGRLTLHVLDLRDEADWVSWIKGRYERLLMRIFE